MTYSPIRAFFIFLLSSCSAEMKPRIEIFMLKLDCGENSIQSNFYMNISILGFISAEHEDKRKIKNARIGELHLRFRILFAIVRKWPYFDTSTLNAFYNSITFVWQVTVSILKCQYLPAEITEFRMGKQFKWTVIGFKWTTWLLLKTAKSCLLE